MAGDTSITIIGNLTGDPELKFLSSGHAVANFTIASTPRSFDRQANEWKDGETLFMNGTAWRQLAENVAESLRRGDRVIATGFIKQRSYETQQGEKRTIVEMDVQEIGPALSRGTARLQKVDRQQGGQQQQGQQQQGGWQQPPQQGGWGQQQGGWGQPPQQPPQPGGWGQPQGSPPGWAQPDPQQQPPQKQPPQGPGGWQPPGPGY